MLNARACAALLLLWAVPAIAQSTAFTYQGVLKHAGAPAEGSYDLRFSLHDDAAGGAPLGSTICLNNVQIADGSFTTSLDFGQAFVTPNPRYLEIQVRADAGQGCSNASGYTTLSPRQLITPAPAATHAYSAASLSAGDGSPIRAVHVDAAGQVGIGVLAPDSKLHVGAGDIEAGADGEEWILHTRSHAGGDFLQITDSDDGVRQFQRGLVVHENGNVGVGTTSPQAKLDVNGSIRVQPTFRYTTVHGSAFMPTFVGFHDPLDIQTAYSGEFGIYSADRPVLYFAPIQLPHGATIVQVSVFYVNEFTNVSLSAQLRRSPVISTAPTQVMASLDSGPGSGSLQSMTTSTITTPTIDNANYVYHLQLLLNGSESNEGGMSVKAVRITYTVTNPLP